MVHNLTDGHARIVDKYEPRCQDDDEHGAYLFQKTLQTRIEVALLARRQLQIGYVILHSTQTLVFDFLAVE